MHEEERAALRVALRTRMLGAAASSAANTGDDADAADEDDHAGHSHGPGGHGHGAEAATPGFLLQDSATRVIGVSSGKGESASQRSP